MNRLLIELYIDEDVDVLVAELVRADGYVATTARDEGQLKKGDAEQLAYAVAHQRTFLTHNRLHFAALAQKYLVEGKTHYGIILAVRRPVYEVARRTLMILHSVTADEMENRVRYI